MQVCFLSICTARYWRVKKSIFSIPGILLNRAHCERAQVAGGTAKN